ncbi:hypothetical protein J19TS1_23440 [Heyndrickxia oleronia]|nr:hypothetical protein J19TS1_23440 [Heyndrickxia oleronia]
MNYNQNGKIAQITFQTLIIGIDIAKFKHVARHKYNFSQLNKKKNEIPLNIRLFSYIKNFSSIE